MLLRPDKTLARRLLTEVDFDDRIQGYRLGKRTGALPITMYSFTEVAGFLSGTYTVMDYERLETWIRKVFGDHELAEKIRKVNLSGKNKPEKSRAIKELVVYRLVQCKKIV